MRLRFQNEFPAKKKTTKDVNQFLKGLGLLKEVGCVNLQPFHPVEKYKNWCVWNPKYNIPTFIIDVKGTKCEEVKDYVYENQLTLKGKNYHLVKDICETCYYTISDGIKINILNCHPSHMFCEKCIALFPNECCPKCRKPMTKKVRIESMLQQTLLTIVKESVLIPMKMVFLFMCSCMDDGVYFFYCFYSEYEYASYKRIINSLIFNFFVPITYSWLEMLAKEHSESIMIDFNCIGTRSSILIFLFLVHRITKKLGLQLINEQFLAIAFITNAIPSFPWWQALFSAFSGAAAVNSLLNSASNYSRTASFVVHTVAIAIFLMYTMSLAIYMYSYPGPGHVKYDSKDGEFAGEIFNEPPSFLHETIQPAINFSIIIGCSGFVLKNHLKTFVSTIERIDTKISQIKSAINTIFLENLISLFGIIPNVAV